MATDQLDFWLWILTVGTAVAGGVLSIWGTSRQRKDVAAGKPDRPGHRMVMGSYVLMSISIAFFAIRGLV